MNENRDLCGIQNLNSTSLRLIKPYQLLIRSLKEVHKVNL
jgi:hypothetical protein